MKLDAQALDVPLTAPFRIATGEVTKAENVVSRVAQDGVVGSGESTPFEVITGANQKRVLADLRGLGANLEWDGKEPVAVALGRAKVTSICRDARQALDIAMHDWAAQKKRVPLVTLLGGKPRNLPTSVTIPIVPLEEVPARVEAALDAGFRILKIKSKAGRETETERIRRIRELAGPDVELRVDANAGWSLQEARAMLPVLRRHDVAFLEQPLLRDDLAGHAALVKEKTLPIMLDESVFTLSDAEKAVAAKACDLINIKLAKTGGLVEAQRVADFAAQKAIPCMVGCMIQTRLATSADAHFAASNPIIRHADLDGHTFLASDPIVGGVTIRNGELVIPDEPGLGARTRPGLVAAPLK